MRVPRLLGSMLLFSGLLGCSGTPATGIGLQEGRLASCPDRPNCVSSNASPDSTAFIEALKPSAGVALDAYWEQLKKELEEGPQSTLITTTDDYLHAEFRSALFGFVDDVEFVRNAQAGQIELRSASRVGYSDLGANRERIETLRATLGP